VVDPPFWEAKAAKEMFPVKSNREHAPQSEGTEVPHDQMSNDADFNILLH